MKRQEAVSRAEHTWALSGCFKCRSLSVLMVSTWVDIWQFEDGQPEALYVMWANSICGEWSGHFVSTVTRRGGNINTFLYVVDLTNYNMICVIFLLLHGHKCIFTYISQTITINRIGSAQALACGTANREVLIRGNDTGSNRAATHWFLR